MKAIKRLKASPNTLEEIPGDIVRIVLVNDRYNVIFATGTNPITISASQYDVFVLRDIQPEII